MFNQSKNESRNEPIKSRNIGINGNLPRWTSRIIKPLLIVLGTSLVAIASSQEAKAANFTVVASGLESPRGLTFFPLEMSPLQMAAIFPCNQFQLLWLLVQMVLCMSLS
ncbi:MAG: hypothetical protein AB4206_10235 [Xenococcaceae cyanobacterium]